MQGISIEISQSGMSAITSDSLTVNENGKNWSRLRPKQVLSLGASSRRQSAMWF